MKEGNYANEVKRSDSFVAACESIMLAEMGEWRNYIERAKEMGK